MIVRIDISLTPDDLSRLETEGYRAGWLREEPRKAWTDKERKELIRWLVHKRLGKAYGRYDTIR